jgi:hypothetical protein
MPDQKHIVTVDGQPCDVTLRRASEGGTWQAFGKSPSGEMIVCAGNLTGEDALTSWKREASRKPLGN